MYNNITHISFMDNTSKENIFQISFSSQIKPSKIILSQIPISEDVVESQILVSGEQTEITSGEEQAYFEEAQNVQKIIIQQPQNQGFQSIGLISGTTELQDGRIKKFFGSGCLIGNNIVLTCAHNCYCRASKKQSMNLTFIPGYKNKMGETYFVKRFFYPKQYEMQKSCLDSLQYDYAILILEEQNLSEYGLFALDGKEDNVQQNVRLYAVGYTRQKKLCKSSGPCLKKKSTIIKYQFPTESSISGSPIFNEETKKIIGIHLGALNSEKFNVGNRINSKIVNEIKQWSKTIIFGNLPRELSQLTNYLKNYSLLQSQEQNNWEKDNRQWVRESKFYPYKCIGKLISIFDGQKCKEHKISTGCLIGKKFILTTAHSCFNRQYLQQANKIIFYPSINGEQGKEPYFYVIKAFYHNQYKNPKFQDYQKYDFAIIQLQKDITPEYGCLSLDFSLQNVKPQKVIEICGYPSNRGGTMWTASGKCLQIDEDLLRYHIHTTMGQAGSPIFVRNGEKVYLVGIHIGKQESKERKVGIRLKPKWIKWMRQWVQK